MGTQPLLQSCWGPPGEPCQGDGKATCPPLDQTCCWPTRGGLRRASLPALLCLCLTQKHTHRYAEGGPLLEVRTADGKLYYLNCATEEETLEMIEKVKSVIRSRQTTGYNDIHTLCPHGGETSAISQARRRIPNAWEIAGQARNDDKGESLSMTEANKSKDL